MTDSVINWLLEGDVSIQYQAKRDLLGKEDKNLRKRIEKEGWGKSFLDARTPDGIWGQGFYQPKWISSHYTILDLKNLNISPSQPEIRASIKNILENHKEEDGGVNPGKTIRNSDVCVNGMVMNYACYFQQDQELLKSIVDFILSQQLDDGGFNCRSNRQGAVHSSLHTTISVLEGINEYLENGYRYRLEELLSAASASREFIITHRFFKSDKTGKIINPNFLKFRYPPRWYYNILRALDYFRKDGISYDERMSDALEILVEKRSSEGLWKLAAQHPGKSHFEMEKAGKSSRWITLMATRILNRYHPHDNTLPSSSRI